MNESSYSSQNHAADFKAVIDYFGIATNKPILAGWYVWEIAALPFWI